MRSTLKIGLLAAATLALTGRATAWDEIVTQRG